MILEMNFNRTRQTPDNLWGKIYMVVGFGYAMSMTEMSEFTPEFFGHWIQCNFTVCKQIFLLWWKGREILNIYTINNRVYQFIMLNFSWKEKRKIHNGVKGRKSHHCLFNNWTRRQKSVRIYNLQQKIISEIKRTFLV